MFKVLEIRITRAFQVILQNAQLDLAGEEGEITFERDAYRVADGASTIVLVTEWDEFKTLNYEAIYKMFRYRTP